MREAIGGSWLFGIVITFIALFSSFLAYSITYTKAFNTKNEIINLIEQNEGYTVYSKGDIKNASDDQLKADKSVEASAFLKIKNLGYNYSTTSQIDCSTVKSGDESLAGKMQSGGFCLTKVCPTGNQAGNTYYKITTFIAIRIPVINVTLKMPISGETRTIYYDNGSYKCDVSGNLNSKDFNFE